jgi:hypothetical protein
VNAPPVQRLGSAVLLQGPAVADTAYLVAVGLRALQRRDGVAPMRRWLTLQHLLKAAADSLTSDSGDAAVGSLDDPALLPAEELINTKQAAALLGLTERHTRTLAVQLGARHAGRALVFDRQMVALEANRRAAGKAA